MPAENENVAKALTEVSERLSVLVREEVELAKVEVTEKASSLARGAAAVAVGAVFGVFALVFVLLTIAWGLNSALSSIWLGFLIVMVVLLVLTAGTFLFAWRKLKVGAPTPKMAIEEAQKIRATVKPGERLMATRTPDEIRASIETNRVELGTAVEKLRVEVVRLTDWRGQLRRYEPQVLVGAVAAGFVLGGGIAAIGALTFGRRKRKQNRLGR